VDNPFAAGIATTKRVRLMTPLHPIDGSRSAQHFVVDLSDCGEVSDTAIRIFKSDLRARQAVYYSGLYSLIISIRRKSNTPRRTQDEGQPESLLAPES